MMETDNELVYLDDEELIYLNDDGCDGICEECEGCNEDDLDDLGDYLEGMCHQGRPIIFYKIEKPAGITYTSWYLREDKKYASVNRKSIKELRNHWSWRGRNHPGSIPVRMAESTLETHKFRKYKQWEVDEYGNIIEQILPEKELGIKIQELPKFAMPSFPTVTVPSFPDPPVSIKNMNETFTKLGKHYKNITNKYHHFVYQPPLNINRSIGAYGLPKFIAQGAKDMDTWYKPKSCGTLDVGCHASNIKKIIGGIFHTKAFLSYITTEISNTIATGISLNKKAGEDLLENLTALPKDAKDWFTKLQKNYSKAMESYIKSIQCEMVTVVDRLRGSINTAFKNADKQFKALVAKYSGETKKALENFKTNLDNIKNDFDKQVSGVKKQITDASAAFTKDIKGINKLVDDVTKEMNKIKTWSKDAISNIDKQIENAKKEMDKITKEINKVKTWSVDADTRIKKLEEKVKLPVSAAPIEPSIKLPFGIRLPFFEDDKGKKYGLV